MRFQARVCVSRFDEHDGLGAVFRRNLLGLDEDILLEIVARQKLVVNRVDASTSALRVLDALAVRLGLFFEFRMPENKKLVAVDGDPQQHDDEDRHDREAADADGKTLASGGFCFLQVVFGLQWQVMAEIPAGEGESMS